MQKHLLALCGPGTAPGSGKTTTIGLVFDKLTGLGNKEQWIWVSGKREKGRRPDFNAVFIIQGKKVGITSFGDLRSILEPILKSFADQGCTIIVCASRTRGGTLDLLKEYKKKGWKFDPIEKKHSSHVSQHAALNECDAAELVAKMSNLTSPEAL